MLARKKGMAYELKANKPTKQHLSTLVERAATLAWEHVVRRYPDLAPHSPPPKMLREGVASTACMPRASPRCP